MVSQLNDRRLFMLRASVSTRFLPISICLRLLLQTIGQYQLLQLFPPSDRSQRLGLERKLLLLRPSLLVV